MRRPARSLGVVLALAVLAGCATTPDHPDPCEGVNRALFGFNDKLDRWMIEPAADGWSFITPELLRLSLDRFFKNLKFPVRFVSNLGQAEVRHAGSEFARFVVNTTVGLAGFFDPATRFGLGQYDEDFGQMFGRWGVPAGAYWVLPFFGPSNPRDAFGLIFDSALNPLPAVGALPALINTRAIADPQVDLARHAALDYYVFVRDAYIQRRLALVRNGDLDEAQLATGPSDDLYEVEDDDLYEVEDDDLYEVEEEISEVEEGDLSGVEGEDLSRVEAEQAPGEDETSGGEASPAPAGEQAEEPR